MFALGLLLVLVGAILVAAEAHVPSHGVLGSGAIVALAIGAALLFSAAGSTVLVALFAGLGIALTGGTWVTITARKALATRRLRQHNTLVGRMGVARGADCVFVDGALWRARAANPDEHIEPGERVVVERVDGLTLTVRRAESWELTP
jgi:membrane-bound serine protease (ClpP class)